MLLALGALIWLTFGGTAGARVHVSNGSVQGREDLDPPNVEDLRSAGAYGRPGWRQEMKEPQTRTVRYISGRSPKAGFDGVTLVSPGTLSDPTFVPRLSWRALPAKVDYDWPEFVASIEAAPAGTAFFCDTSLFDDRTDSRLWAALLQSPGKLHLTPRVLLELDLWFASRRGHAVRVALETGANSVVQVEYDDWPETERGAYLHYVNLLGLRKGTMRLAEMRFERDTGRPAGANDAQALRGDLQKNLGERGYLFARKGAGPAGPRPTTHWTDEEVVYTAFAHALRTGAETFVLTKDEDLLDQFYRLVYLVDTHYRSMLIADAYVRDFASFRTHPMPRYGPYAEAFTGTNNVLVERSENLPREVLPARFSFVAVHCLVLGERLSSMTFGAEREMHQVLEIKGGAGGRNSRALLPRNVHLSLPDFSWPEAYGNCFAIAEDRCLVLPSSGHDLPYVDCVQAVLTSEHYKHFEERHPLL